MLRTKRFLTVLLAVVMILQTIAMPTFALETTVKTSAKTVETIAKFKDFPKNSWSTEALTAAVENGLIVGTSATKIEPRKNLTRAEFAAIISRAFGATEKADITNFKDVEAGKWYYEPIAKAVQMGVMNGTGATTFAPNDFMKREDVILALSRVLFVDGRDASVLAQFSDRDKIDTWSVAAIAGMVKEGYVNGYENGTIRPRNLITREELAQLFHNIFKTYISAEGTYTSVAKKGSVIVRSKDVTLKDVTINGDLVMADGIGSGDFRLENVEVTGKILARGGEGTVYFVDVESDGLVVINDPNGVVNFHNYRDDVPFKNNLLENTPATFLERKKEEDKKPSSPGSGPVTKYSLTFYDIDGNPIVDGKIGVKNEKGTYKVRDFDVPTDEYMYEDGYEFVGWTDGVETKSRNYFISKNLSSVDGKWYPVYLPVTVTPDEYTITFVTPDGEVPVTKTEGEALEDSDIPSVTPPAGFTFEGWSTTENDDEAEFTNDDLTAGNVEDVFASTDVKLYPVYKEIPVTYTVEFKNVDGSEALPAVTKDLVSTQDYVLTASDVYDPAAPAGFRFIGWTTTEDGTDYLTSQSLRVSIKSLGSVYYAQFEEITVPETPVTYTVEFKNVDGTEALPTVTKELLSADDYVLTDADVYDLAKTGYNFLGWTTTVDGTDYISSAELRVSIKTLGTVYYAQFEEILDEYTITFVTSDGEVPVTKTEGEALEDTDIPSVTPPAGFTFEGWSTTENDDEAEFTNDDLTAGNVEDVFASTDVKLYPVYKEIPVVLDEYEITFVTPDGEVPVTKTEGEALEDTDIPSVTPPAGFTFEGWSTTENDDEAEFTNNDLTAGNVEDVFASTDVKLYPVYKEIPETPVTYVVEFKNVDGTEALPTVTKELLSAEDYVLTAGDVYDPTAPAGFRFIGWTTTVDGTDYLTSQSLRVSIKSIGSVYYAQFEEITVPETPVTYTVEFKNVDGTEALPTVTKELLSADDYVLTDADVYDLAKTGYNFLGWTTTVDGTDYISSAELRVSIKTLGTVYYAQFEEITVPETPVTYTVEFKNVDGTEALPTVTKELLSADDYVLTDADVYDLAKTGYNFLGWTTTVDGTDYISSAELRVSIKTLEEVYYAQFEEIDEPVTKYYVYFNANGGTGTMDPQEFEAGVAEALSRNYFRREGYTFAGWNSKADGTGVSYSEYQLLTLNSDLTVYAKWLRDYKIIFNFPHLGTDTTFTIIGLETHHINVIPNVTVPSGYVFEGWSETEGATVADFTNEELLSTNVEDLFSTTTVYLYAVLSPVPVTPVTYTVKFLHNDGSRALPAVTKSLLPSEDYVLTDSDVYDVGHPTAPADYEFLGWTEEVDGTDYITSEELQISIKTLGGKTYYAQFGEIEKPVTYTVEFKYTDGTEALPTVTKSLLSAQDYVLTDNDVYNPDHPTAPADYRFLGWTTTVDGTDYITSQNLRISIKSLGSVYYAQFEEIIVPETPVKYSVEFKYDDGTTAIPAVVKELLSSEDYVLTEADVFDVIRSGYTFLGWTTTVDGTNYLASEDLRVSIKNLNSVYYAQFEPTVTPVTYKVIFKHPDGDVIVEKDDPDYLFVGSDVASAPSYPHYIEFRGWSQDPDAGMGDFRNDFVGRKISELVGIWYPITYEEKAYISFEWDLGYDSVFNDYSYIIKDSDMPDAPEVEGYDFLGWAEDVDETDSNKIYDRNYFIGKMVGDIAGGYYAILEGNFSISFSFNDGAEAIPGVEHTLRYHEDYKLTISDVVDVQHPVSPVDYKFLGWSLAPFSDDYVDSAELVGKSVKELSGNTYYAQFEKIIENFSVVFRYTDGTEISRVEKALSPSENYILTASDVYDVAHPTAPADYRFIGWTTTVDGTNYLTSQSLRVGIKSLGSVYYAQFEEIIVPETPVTYTVEFKNVDGTEAIPAVTKALLSAEDYVLTSSDVYDATMTGYVFLGWTTTVDGTDYIASEDLRVSIKTLGTVYYAQFEVEPEKPVTYTVEFKYTDGTTALATVTKDLLSSEDYVLTASDVYDVEYPTTPEDYEFLGWTTTVDGADYMTSEELRASIKTLASVYYAQFKHIDDVEYYVEHYLEQLDGTYVLDTTETFYVKPGTFVTATALATLPDGYEEENTSHPDRVAEGTVPELPETLTLKLFYDLEVITVTYMELGDVALTIDNGTEMIYEVKYGGTIDNFYDPADETKTNEQIKAEIANFIEYNTAIGYGKNYDDEYLYNEFEAKDTDGDGVADKYDYYNKFGKHQYEHEINFNWYVEDDEEEYVLFDVAHVFTSDLDVHSKVKKLNIVIGFPTKLTDEVLTLNVPYEETTRFLDSIRDALFINENIATFPDMTGLEDEFYDKLSEVGGKFFNGEGPVNEDRSINNTDVLIYFYLMMGGKEKYKDWLWNEVEDNLLLDLNDVDAANYHTLRNKGLDQQQALYQFFELKVFGETSEKATNKYFASKKFIKQSTEEKTFEVNEFNEFIMEKVDEKIRSLATLDSVIDEYIGDKIPEGLLNRLPMEIVENVYETRVAHFLEELDRARYEAAHGHPGLTAHSGIEVDVNLVAELLKPIAEFAVDKHEALVNKAKNSSNRGAELFYKYYGENPYASALVGSYGQIDKYFAEVGKDTALAEKYGHLNSNFNNLKTYKIESFENIYKNVIMPLSVETIDALLWYMDPEGGAVDLGRIRNLAEKNEDLILALYNHPNKLMAKYAEEGLPEDMIEYYNDLLSDPEIKAAVEKIDNKVDFDMMFFVEEKLQNATLEVYYLKVLSRVGVPVQNILDKYTNSKAYKELTHEDFVFYLDELEKAWATVDGVENYNATTDYVFENVLEKVGNSTDKAQASFKGFEMIITRFFADYIEQPAP